MWFIKAYPKALYFFFFLLYINDLPKNILSSLVNIFTDYGRTSQNLDDYSLAVKISPMT